jgi:hypothetical protein
MSPYIDKKTPKKQNPKNLHKNRAGGVAQGVGPEFKPQYSKKKKKIIGSHTQGFQLGLQEGLRHGHISSKIYHLWTSSFLPFIKF